MPMFLFLGQSLSVWYRVSGNTFQACKSERPVLSRHVRVEAGTGVAKQVHKCLYTGAVSSHTCPAWPRKVA